MTRPRLLDLFCGAGGAGMGYYRAGFDVVGVDIKQIRHYAAPCGIMSVWLNMKNTHAWIAGKFARFKFATGNRLAKDAIRVEQNIVLKQSREVGQVERSILVGAVVSM